LEDIIHWRKKRGDDHYNNADIVHSQQQNVQAV
jgi:hypothetical protein